NSTRRASRGRDIESAYRQAGGA
ncbi:MAG: hypothetical protein JWQ36_2962, partial [Enterovirga sp.]|nr:hypothetical protein [Enterovirga sp.]